MTDTRPDTISLDPIIFWQTRSFWLVLFSVVSQIARQFDVVLDANEWAETALNVVSLAALLRAYVERSNPQRRVVARLPKETRP